MDEIDRTENKNVWKMDLIDVDTITVTSPAFIHGGELPAKYTCDGKNVNPPLEIDKIPPNTVSLVLFVEDHDAPVAVWDHWIVWNIPPMDKIAENSVPGTQGMNTFQQLSYSGPCPTSGSHRYYYRIFALDKKLDLDIDARKNDVEKAMKGHIIGSGDIMAFYKR